ncbi:hypothetical protein [Burkholderia seminalis]|uniref:hypothetical protein n=1 Tax=Burkholderia seminalis TaxID=488731 RepID=UPI00190415BA|nr:hypothetical protein [Burkholderia seminalis]MBJ9594147.1 hypothetical protein [Burkholderia seminalis]
MDSFCSKITMPDGTVISGAAARERRMKLLGGGDGLIKKVHEICDAKNAEAAAEYAIDKASATAKRMLRTRTGDKVN